MSIQIRDEPNQLGLYFHVTGTLTAQEVRASEKYTYDPQRFSGLRYVIWDMSECQQLELTAADLEEFTRVDADAQRRNRGFMIAVVAPPDLRPEIQSRYLAYQSFYGNKAEIFDDLSSARIWINAELAT